MITDPVEYPPRRFCIVGHATHGSASLAPGDFTQDYSHELIAVPAGSALVPGPLASSTLAPDVVGFFDCRITHIGARLDRPGFEYHDAARVEAPPRRPLLTRPRASVTVCVVAWSPVVVSKLGELVCRSVSREATPAQHAEMHAHPGCSGGIGLRAFGGR